MAARFQADFGIAGIAFGSQLSFLICLLYIQHSLMCLLLGGFGLWNVKAYILHCLLPDCCCCANQEILFANWGPPCRVLVENISEWFCVFFLIYRDWDS